VAPALLGHDRRAGGMVTWQDEIGRLARMTPAGTHLCGYSLGARVALGIAVAHPHLLSRLTLIGGHAGLNAAAAHARIRSDEAWASLIEREGLARFAASWSDQPIFATQRGVDPELLAEQEQRRLAHHPEGLATALHVLGLGRMPDYWPRLPGLRLSVDLVCGELDTKFVGVAARMALELPAARVTVVPSAGHNLLLEAPKVVARVLDGGD
jgi:2-succinyl-6-hydroxy-2,4-cyclohexadiene-1-carboxylate synthase